MSNKTVRVDYIELNVSNIAASRDFYARAFGWTFTDYGPAYTEFNDGRLKGGLSFSDTVRAKGGPLVILFADDLEACQQKVEAAGGMIVKPIFEFPGGRRFHFTDPDGYELSVWSDNAPTGGL